MKKLLAIILTAAMLFSLGACGKKEDKKGSTPNSAKSENYVGMDMSVACIKGPTGVGMAKLKEDAESNKTANNYTFTVASAPDEISAKFLSGEINIASVPTNLAVKLHNKNSEVTMLAVNTLGVLSIIENGDSIKSIKDLKGKTIYSSGQGSNPEYILKYVLKENGLDPEKDVKIQFVATNDELLAALVKGTAEVAMVPEPAATTVLTKKDSLKRVLSMNTEWEKVSDSKLMMGCVVAKKSFIEEHPQQIEKFLEEYKASVNYALKNIDDASKLCEKHGIIPAAAIAKAAIPSCNLTYVSGKEMKNSIIGYFQILLDFDKTSIGGNMPKDSFFYGA